MKRFYILFFILFALVSNSFANQDLQEQVKAQIEKINKLKQQAFAFAPKTIIPSVLKSASVSKKMLDKISYTNGSYKTFAYNEAGLLIDYKNYLYDSWDEKIELQEHQEIEYDKNGNETLFIDRNLDSFDGFIILEKREASYYENHIPKEEIYWEYIDSDKVLEMTGKSVYTLVDATNLKVEDFSWEKDTEEWTLFEKTEIEYSDYEHPITISIFDWSNSSETFTLVEVLEFKYNDHGLVTETIEKHVSEETGELTVGLTIISTYNNDWNLLSEIASGMFMGELIVAYENIYTYENGLLIRNEYNSVLGNTKTEYSYTTDGKLSEKREYYPDYDEDFVYQGLTLQYKDQFNYDSNINLDELAYPSSLDKYYSAFADFCDPFYFQYGALGNTICFSWNYSAETVIEDYRGTYHYSDFEAGVIGETGTNDLMFTSLKFGPNPCRNILEITPNNYQKTEFTIYNCNGKTMHQGFIERNYLINTSSWEKGLYFIHTHAKTYKLLKY